MGREVGEQARSLHGVTYRATDGGQAGVIQRFAKYAYGAGVRPEQPVDELQQRRFAAAALTDDRRHPVDRQRQCQVTDNRTAIIGLDNAFEFDGVR